VYSAGGSSNGRTVPFEGIYLGSIPSPPAVCRKVRVNMLEGHSDHTAQYSFLKSIGSNGVFPRLLLTELRARVAMRRISPGTPPNTLYAVSHA
jgi:hypothetical protein